MNEQQRIARIGELFARVDPQVLIVEFAPGTRDEIVIAHNNIMFAIVAFYEILRSYGLHDFLKGGNYLHDWLVAGESDPNLLVDKIMHDLIDNIDIISTHELENACIVPLAEYTPQMVLSRQDLHLDITPPTPILPSFISDPARALVLRHSLEPEMLEREAPNLDLVNTEDLIMSLDTEDAIMSDVEENPSVDVEMPPAAWSGNSFVPVYPEMPPDVLPLFLLFARPTPGPVPMPAPPVPANGPANTPVAASAVPHANASTPAPGNAAPVEIRDYTIPVDQRRVFLCSSCPSRYTRGSDLARHVRTAHRRGRQQQ
ncbi:hypothetical protein E4T39_00456 [Aureobasidium subglaciale]|nr:hypothetical protein E4T39_00456 [Aureobasidium subglaciale]